MTYTRIKSLFILKTPKVVLLLFIALTASAIQLTIPSASSSAASKNDWKYENIIDDSIFTDSNSMSLQQIQDFLDSSIGSCDIWGTGTATEYSSSLTRAQYAASRGWAGPPYTCINKYYEVPKTTPGDWTPANNYSNPGSIPSGAQSAAWIIKDAATRYGISPKVILVKIATESAGPLTSDKWPLFSQYRYAMGAQCPDSGPNGSANCNSNYAGFSIQVYEAAALIRAYLNNMDQDWWAYKRVGTGKINSDGSNSNWVGWNVAPRGCGGTVLNIQTKATAALYTYTPYQPNQAALDNMYGTGDYCSAYGYRNFWRVFYDWFGNTRGRDLIVQNVFVDQSLQITPDSSNTANQNYTATFRIRNNSNATIDLGYMFVSVRDTDNNNLDFPVRNIILQPNSTYTYTATRTFPLVGKLKAYIGGNINHVGWTYNVPYSTSDTIARQMYIYSGTATADLITNDVKLDQSLKVSPTTSTDPNQVYTATFTIKNTSSTRVDLGFMFAAVRDSNGNNYDFPSRTISLEPNASYTYTASRTFPQIGKLSVYIGGKFTQIGWDYTLPAASSGSIVRARSIIPKTDVILLNPGISVTKTGSSEYTATATFKNNSNTVQNVGWFLVSARTPSGANVDFPTQNLIIQPGQTVTYSQTRTLDLSELGRFTFFTNLDDPLNGYGWTTTYPGSEQPSTTRQASLLNGPSVVQTKPIQTQVQSDGSIKATVEYTNYGTQKEYMGWVILSTRLNGDSNAANYDFTPQEVTLNAGETRTLTFVKRFVKGGDYSISPIFYRWPNWWSPAYAPVQKTSMSRNASFTSGFSIEQVGDITITKSGSTVTASITLKNKTNQNLEVGDVVISVRDASNNNLDFPMFWATLKPNETKTFQTSRNLASGIYHITSTVHHYLYGWGPTYLLTTNKDYTL